MMDEFQYMLILTTAFAGLLSVSGTGTNVKYVCTGDSVKAFQNIDFDRCNAIVSLNINGERNIQIATWSYQNCIENATVEKLYEGRVLLCDNGTLMINDVNHSDQGRYVVISKKDQLPAIQEVQITLIVAPTKSCKPNIMRLKNTLIAEIHSEECGVPITTPYWKGYDDDVSSKNKALLKIVPGHEDHTYEACIKGVSLQCERNITQGDHCSTFVVKGNTTVTVSTEAKVSIEATVSTESCKSCSTDGSISGIIVLVILLTLSIVTIGVLSFKVRSYIRRWKHSKRYLNHDQLQGIRMYCKSLHPCRTDKLSSLNEDEQQGLKKPLARGDMVSKMGDDHLTDIDLEKISVLTELRDFALCKICLENKTSVFFLPCNHVATCEVCSVPLNVCPVCRTKIEEKKNICF